jgi:hypothetical protein
MLTGLLSVNGGLASNIETLCKLITRSALSLRSALLVYWIILLFFAKLYPQRHSLSPGARTVDSKVTVKGCSLRMLSDYKLSFAGTLAKPAGGNIPAGVQITQAFRVDKIV